MGVAGASEYMAVQRVDDVRILSILHDQADHGIFASPYFNSIPYDRGGSEAAAQRVGYGSSSARIETPLGEIRVRRDEAHGNRGHTICLGRDGHLIELPHRHFGETQCLSRFGPAVSFPYSQCPGNRLFQSLIYTGRLNQDRSSGRPRWGRATIFPDRWGSQLALLERPAE